MLTELTCKQAKPQASPYKLADHGGLYLLIHPNGSKYWRWRYRSLDGKDTTKAVGLYTDTNGKLIMSLKAAREAVDQCRYNLRTHGHPDGADSAPKADTPCFRDVALDWVRKSEPKWSKKHTGQVKSNLITDVFPHIGQRPIGDILAPEILALIARVEEREAYEIAHRTLSRIRSVLTYGLICGYIQINPANGLEQALTQRVKGEYAYLAWDEMPDFLAAVDLDSTSTRITASAFWLLTYTGTRTREVTEARWSEFDMVKAQWIIPAARMKMGKDHIVPLSTQVLALLADLQKWTGDLEYLFPGRNMTIKPMSNMTILRMIDRAGYRNRMTGHGLRKVFSTHANESNLWTPDAIERQLAHVQTSVRAVYNKALYLPERTRMMQWYADELDAIRPSRKKG